MREAVAPGEERVVVDKSNKGGQADAYQNLPGFAEMRRKCLDGGEDTYVFSDNLAHFTSTHDPTNPLYFTGCDNVRKIGDGVCYLHVTPPHDPPSRNSFWRRDPYEKPSTFHLLLPPQIQNLYKVSSTNLTTYDVILQHLRSSLHIPAKGGDYKDIPTGSAEDLKKYASDKEADAGLFLKSLTTFARKQNERVQEYTDRWDHQVNIFQEEDKAPVTDSQLADAYIYGLKYDAILVDKLTKLNTRKQNEQLAFSETVKQHPVLAYKSEIYRDEEGGFFKSERDQMDREWERIRREEERLEMMEHEKQSRAQNQYWGTSNGGGNYGSAAVVTQQPAQRTAQAVGGGPNTTAAGGNWQTGPGQAGTEVNNVNPGGRQCYRCGPVEHLANSCPDKKKELCFKCHEEGHSDDQCPHGEEKESIE
ncbi:hypothetical protein HDV00_006946 [Rhizophlyctis rosea]|nr:hypothetical protein HDV00_006946 [Rhizophlyctis rosea]